MVRRICLVTAALVFVSTAVIAHPHPPAPGVTDVINRIVRAQDDVTAGSLMGALDKMYVSTDDVRQVMWDTAGLDWPSGYYTRTARFDGRSQPYTLYIPANYNPANAGSLMIALHGAGGSGHNFARAWQTVADNVNLVVAAPTMTAAGRWWSGGNDIVGLVQRDVLLSVAVDPNRVFLTGFSNGGHGAWFTGLHEPWRFAGVIPMAGTPTTELQITDNNFLINANSTPFYVWHGEKDSVIPVARTRAAVKEMKKRGYPVHYEEVPGRGHQLALMTDFPPVAKWMEKQKRKPFPNKIDFYCDRTDFGRCYWARLDEIEGTAHITALMNNNEIKIETKNVKQFSLLLSDMYINFLELDVSINGKDAEYEIPEISVRTFLESMRRYGDVETAYCTVLTFDVETCSEILPESAFPKTEEGTNAAQLEEELKSPDAVKRARGLLSLMQVLRRDPGVTEIGVYAATEMTKDPDPVVRSRALSVLYSVMRSGFLEQERAAKVLRERTNDKSALVRADVANLAVGILGNEAETTLRGLGGDTDATVRAAALQNLPAARRRSNVEKPPAGVVKWVIAALGDTDWRVKGAAIDALPVLKIESPKAYELLKTFLSGSDRYLKGRALLAAARLCAKESKAEFAAAKKSKDALIKAIVKEALKQAKRYAKLAKLGIDPGDFNKYSREAYAAISSDKNEEAVELYAKALAINPNHYIAQYNMACALAKVGKKEQALRHLAASILNGYRNYSHMKQDSDLDSLRDTDEYKSWVEEEVLPLPSAAPKDAVPDSMKEEEPEEEETEPEEKEKPEKKKPKKKKEWY
ncbi:MAG: hypothetical protein E3J72_05670 [Planctomycetota bacterium]|nr:MAG: hypothetical protein E3J72_05670 [Planctomycetota bacterium]